MDGRCEHLTRLHGSFLGDKADIVRINASLSADWRDRQLELEPALQNLMWFDYAPVHPWVRSQFFIHMHAKAWRRAFRRYYDEDANVARVFPINNTRMLSKMDQATRTKVVETMQLADEAGIPYDVFLDAAFDVLMTSGAFAEHKKLRKDMAKAKLPKIDLFQRADVITTAEKRFDITMRGQIRVPSHATFKAVNHRGTPLQRRFIRWLRSYVVGRPDANALINDLKTLGILDDRLVNEHFKGAREIA